MSIFDVMGPIMIGPSSSHTAGAAKIGYLAQRIYGRPFKQVHIRLFNSFATTGKGHRTRAAILGGLLGLRVDDERIRRASLLARLRNIDVDFECRIDTEVHPNCAEIKFLDSREEHPFSVRGISVGGGAIRIVAINDVKVDFSGKHHLLFLTYRDEPGMLGFYGDTLARNKVNVAYAQVSRDKNMGTAIAVLKLDSPCPNSAVEELKKHPYILDCVSLHRLGNEYARKSEEF